MRFGRASAWVAALATAGVGCVGKAYVDSEDFVGGQSSQPIINGTTASSYPEAALVDMNGYACSGALIAPRVVLTAGHCVQGMSTWKITLPFANGQKATATGATVYDYTDATDYVNPDQHDLGLVFLGQSLTLDRWPVIPQAPLADGSRAIDVGRIRNGTLSNSALYQSQPIALKSAASEGFPFDYSSTEVIESGDSGGPVISAGSSPHAIVAVNSGGGNGTEVLARTDLLHAWIDQQVQAHGGWGTDAGTSSSGGSTSSGGASGGGTSSSGGSAPGGACAAEVEPNDGFQHAAALGSATCGTLSASDVFDWYTWSIDGAKPYALRLEASGDARVLMWKRVNGYYVMVANSTDTSIEHTSTGPGTYVVLVLSFSASPQSYELTLSGGSPGGSSSGGTSSSSGGASSSSGGGSSSSSGGSSSSSGGTGLDGAALYGTRCARCHGSLATSDKRGATAAQILRKHPDKANAAEAAAIANVL